MAYKNIVLAIPLSSLASTSFGAAYTLVATLTNACFLLRITNNSDQDVTVSYDGTHDHDFVPKATQFNINAQTNSSPQNKQALFPQGFKVYVKGTAGMAGSVYVSGYYQPQTVGD